MKQLSLFILFFITIFYNPSKAQISAKKEGNYRIAVLGCHRQFEPAPALSRYLELDSDINLWIGDNVYADAPDDPEFIWRCYTALANKPAFQQLILKDYMATWDDHDFGLNNAGKEYKFKKESKEMFRQFWKLEKEIPATQDGIYYARQFNIEDKTLQIIMLDVRYNRDAPDSNGDVLGEHQWKWLEAQLATKADLRIIVSGFQILLTKEAGSETWDYFPQARLRLFETIRKTKAENVVFLTGDQHYGEVCRLRNAMDFDAIELQFAGINQIEDPEFNPLRVSPVIQSKHSVAVIDLQMDTTKTDVPHLLFQIADAMTNEIELLYRVNLDEIALNVAFTPQRYFSEQHTIALNHYYPNLKLHYTLDGSEPTAQSPIYTQAFPIYKTTRVKARLFSEDQSPRSRVFERYYERLVAQKPVQLKTLPENGLSYQYYEGNFETLPNFSKLIPTKKGTTTNFDLPTLAQREDHYALLFEGYVQVPANDVYEFFTISDDGSILQIGDRTVVDNNGSHSRRRRSGLIALDKGLHPIRIGYFEDYEGQTLSFGYVNSKGVKTLLTKDFLFVK